MEILVFLIPMIVLISISPIFGYFMRQNSTKRAVSFIGISLILSIIAYTGFYYMVSGLSTIDGGSYEFDLDKYFELFPLFTFPTFILCLIGMYSGTFIRFLIKK